MRSQTVLVRYSHIKCDGAAGVLVTRLAVAVNNCMSGQYLVTSANKLKQDPKTADLGYGIALHLIGVQIGYLYEAMLILDNPKEKFEPTIASAIAAGDRTICRLFDRLSAQGKTEYASLMLLKTDPTQNTKFKTYVEKFRNQAAFHYDAGHWGRHKREKPVVASALDRLANAGKSSRWTRYSARHEAPPPGAERFNFADVVMDTAVCYEIWGIDGKHKGAALRAEADLIVNWIYGHVGAFVGFGSELCNLYFSSKLA